MISFLVHSPRPLITPEQSASPAPDRLFGRWLFLVLLLGALVRLPGLFTDFWLDEIWSYNIAAQLHSVTDVLCSDAARIDNNHPLNTLIIRALGPRQPFWLYRLPALLSGVGSVLLAARVMRRFGRAQSVAAALLMAVSFPFVFYSSEARGYAPAVFFALLAFDALLIDLSRPSIRARIVFVVGCLLGILSHLTFAQFYFAVLIWSLFAIRRREPAVTRQAKWWLSLHTIPILGCVGLYLVFVRHLVIGGAAPRNTIDALISSLAMLIGGPELRSDSGTFSCACSIGLAAVAAIAFVTAIVHLLRQRNDLWLFYALVVVVAPGFLLTYDVVLSARPQPLMLRYFLVATAFALLAISHLPRRAMIPLVLVMVVASAWQSASSARFGRGGYSHALQRMPGASVWVAGDSAFRVGSVVAFYAQYQPPDRKVEFIGDGEAAIQSADWFVATRDDTNPAGFTLDSTYPAPGLSGTTWQVFRRHGGR